MHLCDNNYQFTKEDIFFHVSRDITLFIHSLGLAVEIETLSNGVCRETQGLSMNLCLFLYMDNIFLLLDSCKALLSLRKTKQTTSPSVSLLSILSVFL